MWRRRAGPPAPALAFQSHVRATTPYLGASPQRCEGKHGSASVACCARNVFSIIRLRTLCPEQSVYSVRVAAHNEQNNKVSNIKIVIVRPPLKRVVLCLLCILVLVLRKLEAYPSNELLFCRTPHTHQHVHHNMTIDSDRPTQSMHIKATRPPPPPRGRRPTVGYGLFIIYCDIYLQFTSTYNSCTYSMLQV